MDEKTITIIDDEGNEVNMEILFTFRDDNYDKDYVLYIDPNSETGEVFVSSYTAEGELLDIVDEDEWAMIEEVFEAFAQKHDESLPS